MNTKILKIVFVAGAAAISLSSGAQNLDPTVVVDRAYEGKLLEIHKPALEMAVPDSVRRFDLDFDYSVFDNPYRGSYEFKPYQLLLKPVSADVDMSSFWLKAGAGYTVYPELEAVWSPLRKGPFKMNIYADYHAYFGDYRAVGGYQQEDGVLRFDSRKNQTDGKLTYWNGYRMRTQAGVDGRYDWEKSAFDFDLGYYGNATKDIEKIRNYNALDVSLGMASKPQGRNYFHYDIDLDYRFGGDYLPYKYGEKALREHLLSFGAEMGPVMHGASRIILDAGFNAAAYSRDITATIGEIVFTPHYIYDKGRWLVDLGLRLDMLFRPELMDHYQHKSQVVYPDVKIKFAAVRDALSIYMKADGGSYLNTYSSLLERNPYSGMEYMIAGQPFYLDTTVERVNARLGFEGRISRRFTYDIHAGYANYSGALLDCVDVLSGGWAPGYAYGDYQKFYAGAGWNLNAENVSFDGKVEYVHATSLDEAPVYFLPATLTGDVAFMYNWNRRVFAGVDCMFSTARKGTVVQSGTGLEAMIPGYADLGVSAEYAATRKLSVWLRGGNLINMTIQRTPLYAEKGINFTAGIRLKL